jgi:hypothetical protein
MARPAPRPRSAEARRTAITPAAAVSAVEGSMRTKDGQWEVDVMRRDDHRWHRIRHDDNVIDHLTINQVEAIVGAGGVDLSTLTEQASHRPACLERSAARQSTNMAFPWLRHHRPGTFLLGAAAIVVDRAPAQPCRGPAGSSQCAVLRHEALWADAIGGAAALPLSGVMSASGW